MAVKENVLSSGEATFRDGIEERGHVNEDNLCDLGAESTMKALSLSESLSNESSHNSEKITSCPSLSEFQKVSAFLIDVSGSSASLSGTDNAQDTDISDSEVFGTDTKSSETLCDTEKNTENSLLIINRSDNSLVSEFSVRSSIALEQKPEFLNPASEIFPSTELHSAVSSGDSSQKNNNLIKEELIEGVEGQCTAPSAPAVNYIGMQSLSQHYSGHGEYMDIVPGSQGNSMLSISELSETGKMFAANVSDGKHNSESKHLPSTHQSKIENTGLLAKEVAKPVDANYEFIENPLALQPDPAFKEPKMAPLALESEDLAIPKGKMEYSADDQGACKPSEIPTTNTERVLGTASLWHSAANGMTLLEKEDFPSKTLHEEKQPLKTNLISKETENNSFSSTSPIAFDAIENIAPEEKSDVALITDEVSPPTEDNTLSEILSPVDEQLSYGSSEFPSTKMELSCQSDDLPSFPEDASILSNEGNQNLEDFPSPPEGIILFETESGENQGISSLPAEMPVSSASLPLFTLSSAASFNDYDNSIGSSKQKHAVTNNTTCAREVNESSKSFLQSSHLQASPSEGQKIPSMLGKNRRPFLTLSTEEDSADRLLSFEIGDRVLVKHTHPGTLKFKGKTQFDDLYLAGVALDKPEGDHDGTYGGVRYFECAKLCGIFVRPHQISHLLEGDDKSVEGTDDEDSFFDGPASGTDNNADHQGTMFTQEKLNKGEKRNASAFDKNASRSETSRSSGSDERASSSQCPAQAGKENTSTEILSASTDVKQEICEEQCDTAKKLVLKDGAVKIDEQESLEHMLNTQDCLQLLSGWKEMLADKLSHQILTELLCDTVNVLSGTSRHKCVWTSGGVVEQVFFPKTKDVAVVEEYDHSAQTTTKVASGLFWQLATLTNPDKCHKIPRYKMARQIKENIMSKFAKDVMKEYLKIKRQQLGENKMRLSHNILPLLRKVLDAGVFGECDYFDEPPVETEEIPSHPRLSFLKLDRWCTAQWKKPKELSLVVPHNVPHVKNLTTRAVEELLTHNSSFPAVFRPTWAKVLKCEALGEEDLNAESTRMYNQVIVDLTQELLEKEWSFPSSRKTSPWKMEKVGSWFSKPMPRKQDLNELKSFIQAEILRILKLEGADLELQSKLQKMTKFGSCKRDLVDNILIQEIHQEERQWIDYAQDELAVKMKLTDDILSSLVHEHY